MARLTVSLLGSFDIKLGDQPVTALVTGKVRALLAYLVVEADRPHRRETLAGLLWPDYPERSARASLRNALSDLRAAVGDRGAVKGHHDPHLLVTREAQILLPFQRQRAQQRSTQVPSWKVFPWPTARPLRSGRWSCASDWSKRPCKRSNP
jgi:DNA-binding SARP family transcriptional activator